MEMKKGNVALFGMLAIMLLLFNSNPGQVQGASTKGGDIPSGTEQGTNYLIVALGDSVTAGYEPGMVENSIPYGYVDRLKEQGLFYGRTDVENYGILGLTSTGLNNYVKGIKQSQALLPDDIQAGLLDPRIAAMAGGTAQAKTDLEAAKLITITIGGNDVSSLLAMSSTDVTTEQFDASVKPLLEVYSNNLRQIVKDLVEINPQALIVIADQYQPVPDMVLTRELYPKLQTAAQAFTTSLDQLVSEFTANGAKVKVAHVAKAFVGQELVLTHMVSDQDFHPKQAGYELIANIFAKEIWGAYRTTDGKQGTVPISIVVHGKELQTPYKPILKNGQTFVAIKDIVDAVGATSKWDSKTNSVTVTYNNNVVVIPIGSKTVQVNGKKVTTAFPAFLNKQGKEQKTYVPLALLAQGLGFDVKYSAPYKTAFINP